MLFAFPHHDDHVLYKADSLFCLVCFACDSALSGNRGRIGPLVVLLKAGIFVGVRTTI